MMIVSEKSHQKSIGLYPAFIQKISEVDKKVITSSEKMRNSGNHIYDYAHPFFGEDF